MKTLLEPETTTDTQLVELCLSGNRNAFAQIVERYQAVICAIAYSTCGDIGRSEDLAQDTFIAAWRQLGALKEPEKLKPWLCGIIRNLVNQSARQQHRTPTAMSEPMPPETAATTETPSDEAISREEEMLLWRALESIPESYREPMILYYRENRSTRAVAEALDLSEELVRKRLSRGRELLSERLEKTLEIALVKTSPGKSFAIGVLAALPAFSVSTKTASIAAATAKSGAAAKAMGVAGLFGPVLSIIGPYFGMKLEIDDARTPEARKFVRRFFAILFAGMALFIVAALTLGALAKSMSSRHPALYIGLWIGISISYAIFAIVLALSSHRRRQKLRAIQYAPPLVPAFEYRSKLHLLGLPLVHIRMRGGIARGPVKAWFAAGDSAIGVIFAFGGMAIAPFSFGGIAVGLLPFGGFAVGLLPFGGFSIGPFAAGAFALGWQAIGACAVAWQAAFGVVALAHGYALGAFALAAHVNDPAAGAFLKNSEFLRTATIVMNSSWFNLLYFLWLLPIFLWLRVKRMKRQRF